MARLAAWLAGWATRRPWTSLLLCLGLCLALAVPAMRLRLSSDLFDLLPAQSPELRDFRELVANFGAGETAFAAIAADATDDATRARAMALADAMAEEVGAATWRDPDSGRVEPLVQSIAGVPQRGLLQALEDTVVARTWLLLDDHGVDTLVARLQPKRFARLLAIGPGPATPLSLAGRDPLRLWSDLYLPFWLRGRGDSILHDVGGHLVARDGRWTVLALRLAWPPQRQAFSRALAAGLGAARDRALARVPHDGLRLHLVGGHFVAASDYAAATTNAWHNIASSLIGVLALFFIVYRSVRLVALIAAVLVPSVLAAAGLTGLLLGGHLTLLASSFAAIVVGAGVEFIVQLYNGYGVALARRGEAGPPDRAARARAATESLTTLMPSIAAGCLTTIVSFATLMCSAFHGLIELGLLSTIALALIFAQLMVVLPAFLALGGSRRVRHVGAAAPLARFVVRRWRPLGIAIGALVASAAVVVALAPEPLRFDADARALRPAHDPVVEAQRAVARGVGLGENPVQVMFRSTDVDAAVSAFARFGAAAAPLARARATTVRGATDVAAALAHGTLVIAAPAEGAVTAPVRLTTPAGELVARAVASRADGALALSGIEAGDGGALGIIADGAAATIHPAVAPPLIALPRLPAPERERAVLERLAHEVDFAALDAVRDADAAAARRYAAFWSDLAEMRARVAERRPLRLDELADSPLAPLIGGFYRAGDDGRTRLLATVSATDTAAGLGIARALVDALGPIPGVEVVVTGSRVLGDALQTAMFGDFVRLTGIATAIIAALLMVLMTRRADAVLAMATLVAGVVVLLAAMRVAHLAWNLVNLAVMPLILGIGIDNGIYLINALRRRRDGPAAVEAAVTELGHPMLMTSGASLVGFGSLALSDYRGLQSLGWIAMVGLVVFLAISLFGIPALALATSHRARRIDTPDPAATAATIGSAPDA